VHGGPHSPATGSHSMPSEQSLTSSYASKSSRQRWSDMPLQKKAPALGHPRGHLSSGMVAVLLISRTERQSSGVGQLSSSNQPVRSLLQRWSRVPSQRISPAAHWGGWHLPDHGGSMAVMAMSFVSSQSCGVAHSSTVPHCMPPEHFRRTRPPSPPH